MKSEPAYICSRIMNLYYTTIFQLDDVGRRSSPDAKEAHHRLNKASPVRGLHHAEYQPSCKNHFVFEDLELNQAKPPRNQIHHFHQFSFEVNKQKQIQKKHFLKATLEVYSQGMDLSVAFKSPINCVFDEVDSLLGCQTSDNSDNRDISLL